MVSVSWNGDSVYPQICAVVLILKPTWFSIRFLETHAYLINTLRWMKMTICIFKIAIAKEGKTRIAKNKKT